MATNTRKTRAAKVERQRYRFGSATDAKAVEQRLLSKNVDSERTGKFLSILPDDFRSMKRAAQSEEVDFEQVLGRGRPRKDAEAPAAKKAVAKPKVGKAKPKAQKKRDASEVVEKLPAKYKAGAKKSARPEAKRLKKPSERTKPVWVLNVKSSNIEKALYNLEKKRLTIIFHGGKKYVYEAVTLKEFIAFTNADSQGEFFTANIKPVKKFRKIEA